MGIYNRTDRKLSTYWWSNYTFGWIHRILRIWTNKRQ